MFSSYKIIRFSTTQSTFTNKVFGIRKCSSWVSIIENEKQQCHSKLANSLINNDTLLKPTIKSKIHHLKQLEEKLYSLDKIISESRKGETEMNDPSYDPTPYYVGYGSFIALLGISGLITANLSSLGLCFILTITYYIPMTFISCRYIPINVYSKQTIKEAKILLKILCLNDSTNRRIQQHLENCKNEIESWLQ